jgi:hypothetical protein
MDQMSGCIVSSQSIGPLVGWLVVRFILTLAMYVLSLLGQLRDCKVCHPSSVRTVNRRTNQQYTVAAVSDCQLCVRVCVCWALWIHVCIGSKATATYVASGCGIVDGFICIGNAWASCNSSI